MKAPKPEKMESAGTATFFQRFALTERLQEMILPFLDECGVEVAEYGQNVILGHNGSLEARLKKLEAKKSPAALMVKFAPDFLCMYRETKTLYFMDIKTSLTPVLFTSKLDELSRHCRKHLCREQVGLVEREAWDNYTTRYPAGRTAIVMACPYNPRLLVAEWAGSIRPLFRFEEDINRNAAGSMTPHVNIDLDSMRDLATFMQDEFNCEVPRDHFDAMVEYIKTWPLSNPGRPWMQFNACVRGLQMTCPWLRQRNKEGWIDGPNPGLTLGL